MAIIGYENIFHQLDYLGKGTLIPIIVLLITCLASTILALQAAMPKMMGKKNGHGEEVKPSMMFFGVSSNYTQRVTYRTRPNITSKKASAGVNDYFIGIRPREIL